MKRFLPWLIVIGGLLLIAFVVRHLRSGGAATYQTANVTRGPITQAVTATGTLNPALFQATVTQAEGDLANAQAALELARINAKRTQDLFARKTSAQADVDQA